MATRHFENANPGTIASYPRALWMSGYAAPLRLAQIQTERNARRERGAVPVAAVVDLGNISRCVRWAFALEGGAALLVYGLWTLLRIWR